MRSGALSSPGAESLSEGVARGAASSSGPALTGRFPFGPTPLVLDGGLSTELETEGLDLDDPLWTARVLLDRPDAIRRAHRRFLEAGAEVVTSATYQASFAGFAAAGLTEAEAERALRRGVRLAAEARDGFMAARGPGGGRRRPLVAVSVGPYGAFLADGSEYRGNYGVDDAVLAGFHRQRLVVLVDEARRAGAELLAVETIPSAPEAVVLADLLAGIAGRADGAPAARIPFPWMSFSCRDGRRLRDGAPVAATVRAVAARAPLVAVGVNCTAPEHLSSVIREIRSATDLPVVAYPNGGGRWDATTKTWAPGSPEDLPSLAPQWRALGASAIGGCCQVDAAGIRRIRRALESAAD